MILFFFQNAYIVTANFQSPNVRSYNLSIVQLFVLEKNKKKSCYLFPVNGKTKHSI